MDIIFHKFLWLFDLNANQYIATLNVVKSTTSVY